MIVIRDFLTEQEDVSVIMIIVPDKEACVVGLVLVVLSGSVVSWYTMISCQHTFVREFTQAVKLDM